MKLERITIQGYKHLKHIVVEFNNESQAVGNFPVRFCIGQNGAGKSVFLEAVALIFSRASNGELPGFSYEVQYTVWRQGRETSVLLRAHKGKLEMKADGQTYTDTQQMRMFLPYRIVTSISGRNSQMRDLLDDAAREALLQDIYEASEHDPQALEEKLRWLRELSENSRCIFVEEDLASLVLFVLCAWRPRHADDGYERLRSRIFDTLGNGFSPVLLSLKADRVNLSENLFGSFFYGEEAAPYRFESENMVHAVFAVSGEGSAFDVESISRQYSNPLTLLSVLLQAKKEGVLHACHVFFHLEGSQELLDETVLSDGEISWTARMGLILLARQWESDNCLFLLDEPDVHLNERWNVEFVSFLQELSELDNKRMHHEFLVSTHSSLILTDALPEQLYLFERRSGEAAVRTIPVSSFGADRSEISRMLFANRAVTGAYAERIVEHILEQEENPKMLRAYIEDMGPGMNRFQVLSKYYDIIENRG